MNHAFTVGKWKFKTFEKHTRQGGRKSLNTYIDVKVKRGSKWLSIFDCYPDYDANQLKKGDGLEVDTDFQRLRRVMGDTVGSDLILEILDKVAQVYNCPSIQLTSVYGFAKMKDCLDGVDADSAMELISAVHHGLSYLNLKGYFPLGSSGKILTERRMRNYYKKLLNLSITKILNEEPPHEPRYPYTPLDTVDLKKRYRNMTVEKMIRSIFVPGHTLTRLQCSDLKTMFISLRRFRFSKRKFRTGFWYKQF